MLGAIKWDFNPEIIEGYPTPNYYGLLFVTGLVLGFFVIRKMFRKEGVPDAKLDKLLLYVIIATIVGARLGHVLFYGPYFDHYDQATGKLIEGYFSHPLSILKVWEGGLASHGGAIALLIALWIFSKREVKQPVLWIFDRIAAPIAIAGTFIRLGNLANGEIVGHETNVPWAFQFMREDCPYVSCPWEEIPARHPAQLYEAIGYLAVFALLMFLYWKKNWWKIEGRLFGVFLVVLWSVRFFAEFVKEGQTERDDVWALNTGQILSIPLILFGFYLLFRKKNRDQISIYHPELENK